MAGIDTSGLVRGIDASQALDALAMVMLRRRQIAEQERAAAAQEQEASQHNRAIEGHARVMEDIAKAQEADRVAAARELEAQKEEEQNRKRIEETNASIAGADLNQAAALTRNARQFNRQTGQTEYGEWRQPTVTEKPMPEAPALQPEPQAPQAPSGTAPSTANPLDIAAWVATGGKFGAFTMPQEPSVERPEQAFSRIGAAPQDDVDAAIRDQSAANYDSARQAWDQYDQATAARKAEIDKYQADQAAYEAATSPMAAYGRERSNEKAQATYDRAVRQTQIDNEAARDAAPISYRLPGMDWQTTSVAIERQKPRDKAANEFDKSVGSFIQSSAMELKAMPDKLAATMAGSRLEKDRQNAVILSRFIRDGFDSNKAMQLWWQAHQSGESLDAKEILGQEKNDAMARRPRPENPMAAVVRDKLNFEGERQKLNDTRKDVTEYLQKAGLRDARDNVAQLNSLESQLKSGNPQQQQNALVTMARMAQKDGRFSDADYRLFVQNVGSLGDSIETITEKLATGEFGEGRMNIALTAARALTGIYKKRISDGAATAKSEFLNNPYYDSGLAESLISQHLPGYERDRSKDAYTAPQPRQPGKKPQAAPKPAPASGGSVVDSLGAKWGIK